MSVDEIRLAEASEIVQAYRDRLDSHHYELGMAYRRGGDALAVMRRIRATTMELLDAEGYETRCRDRLQAPRVTPSKRQEAA